jgi:hypothetical protein
MLSDTALGQPKVLISGFRTYLNTFSRHTNHRIGAHLHSSYRTLRDGSCGWAVPGTSCQATIGASLRDGTRRLSRLKMSKLQWHEVP